VPPDQDGIFVIEQRVRAVVLDVVVTNSAGGPVPGLTMEDFTVLEDGRPQRIASFEPPGSHALPAVAANATGRDLLQQSAESPLTIVLVDEISTEPEDLQYARKQLERYITAQPNMLKQPTMLLVLTNSRIKVVSDYTVDREHLLLSLKRDPSEVSWYVLRDRVPGFKATGTLTVLSRLKTYLATLSEVAIANAAYPGRKNLIWIGPGLPALNSINVDLRDRDKIDAAIRSTSRLLLSSRLAVYTVDPQGIIVTPTNVVGVHGGRDGGQSVVSSGVDPAVGELSFEQLALETGGRIMRRNDVDTEIGESTDDGATYYTLSYYPSNNDWNGKYRRIKVQLREKELKARTRDGYDAVLDPKPTEAEVDRTLTLALTSSLNYEGIAFSADLRPASSPASIHLVADSRDLSWKAAANGKKQALVTVVAGMIAADGRVISNRTMKMKVEADEASRAGHGSRHADFVVPAEIPDKAAFVRILIHDDGNDRIGSKDLPVNRSPQKTGGGF
jgi:VWFA-related protein